MHPLLVEPPHRCCRRSVPVRASGRVERQLRRAQNTPQARREGVFRRCSSCLESLAHRTQDFEINCSLQTWLENFSFPHRIQHQSIIITIFPFLYPFILPLFYIRLIDIVMRRRSICRRRIKSTVVIVIVIVIVIILWQ